MFLMRLRHYAVIAYGLYILLMIVASPYHVLSTDWLDTAGIGSYARFVFSFLFAGGCWICARALQVKGRLS